MTRPDDFTRELARCVLNSSERFHAATALGHWRSASRAGLDPIACLETAARHGGADLPVSDWVVLCTTMAPAASDRMCTQIWEAEHIRRTAETLRVKGTDKPTWFAVLSDGTKIPTTAAVVHRFRRVYSKQKLPIEFQHVENDVIEGDS